jgi:hypothetical protein
VQENHHIFAIGFQVSMYAEEFTSDHMNNRKGRIGISPNLFSLSSEKRVCHEMLVIIV